MKTACRTPALQHSSSGNLVEQVAERLGPDGMWQDLKPYIPSLEPPRNGKVEVRALCPFHDDSRPSWCWNLARGIATCHVCGEGDVSFVKFIAQQRGCTPVAVLDEYCKRFGLPRPRSRILTLADYATAKGLPADFLADRFDLSDSEAGLRMPYIGADGALLTERIRKHLSTKPRWAPGVRARRHVYGLHGLPWIGPTGYILVVEGESDLQTAWFHDLPALATLGATVGHQAMADVVNGADAHTVYVVPDSDQGGRTMLTKMDRALRLAGWTGTVLAVRLPTKDLSDLHTHPDADFDAAFNACLTGAEPLAEALTRLELQVAAEDDKMTKLMRTILPKRELSGTEKTIVLAVAIQVEGDLTRPVPVTKKKLAKLAGVRRRTFYNRLPHIVEAGFLRDDGNGLYPGVGLVQ